MPSGRRSGEIAVAASVCALGFLVLGALLAHLLDPAGSLLSLGGELLFTSFSWAAFLIPAFLFVSASYALSRAVRGRRVAALALSAIPFLTLSLLLKVLSPGDGSPLPEAVLSAFGRSQGILALSLALGLELSLLAVLMLSGRDGREDLRGSAGPESRSALRRGSAASQSPDLSHGIVPAAASLVRLLEEPFASRQSHAAGSPESAIALVAPAPVDPRAPPEPAGPDRSGTEPAEPGLTGVAQAEPDPAGADTPGPGPEAPEVVEIEPALLIVEDTPESRLIGGNGGDLPGMAPDDLLAAGDELQAGEPDEDAESGAGEPELIVEADPEDEEGEAPEAASGAEVEKPRARRKAGAGYHFPVEGILKEYEDGAYWEIDSATQRAAEVLKDTLEEFNISAEVTGIRKGPVITMFEVLPAPGVKISKIANLADNIALRLAASRVRIVAPIPGKHAVGIEVPNRERAIVSLREMVSLPDFRNSKFRLPVVLGKGISGEAKIIDLTQTPHLLIAGATGAGKSVCVNALISSILYSRSPEEARLILVDPKIVELKYYNDIPHLLTPVITDTKRSYQALQYCICEMERRYALLDVLGVRDIASYNRKVNTGKTTAQHLPYIIFVIDEFADLMAQSGKEMESTLARLAAMSRAVGIHLVLATQRPSIDVITGLIKANIPSRIAFMVASKFDSRIIIDGVGAEKLLGKGDMLFTASWDPMPQRLQGAFISEDEVEAVAAHARTLGEPDYIDDEMFIDEDDAFVLQSGEDDPLMDQALEIVVQAGKASASYLQRRLKIGYNRAARLVEDMEQRGIVGPAQGSKPRDLIHVPDRPQ